MPSISRYLLATAAATPASTCLQIHGRAIHYGGDGFLAIWHIGTHHVFYPADLDSQDMICHYLNCAESSIQVPALFADFTVCPAEPYKPGAAQPVIVKKIEHPYLVPDWQPASAH